MHSSAHISKNLHVCSHYLLINIVNACRLCWLLVTFKKSIFCCQYWICNSRYMFGWNMTYSIGNWIYTITFTEAMGRLNMSVIRYFQKDHFRVLTAVSFCFFFFQLLFFLERLNHITQTWRHSLSQKRNTSAAAKTLKRGSQKESVAIHILK